MLEIKKSGSIRKSDESEFILKKNQFCRNHKFYFMKMFDRLFSLPHDSKLSMMNAEVHDRHLHSEE